MDGRPKSLQRVFDDHSRGLVRGHAPPSSELEAILNYVEALEGNRDAKIAEVERLMAEWATFKEKCIEDKDFDAAEVYRDMLYGVGQCLKILRGEG